MSKITKDSKKEKALKIKVLIFAFVCVLLALSFMFNSQIEKFLNFKYNYSELSTDGNDLKFYFIDVGQADCIAIEFPNGEHMLVDTGENSTQSQDKMLTYLDEQVFNDENEENIFEYLILTHFHSDHIGGACEIFNTYEVKNCYMPNYQLLSKYDDEEDWSNLMKQTILSAQNEDDCNLLVSQAGVSFMIGDVKVEMFAPDYSTSESRKVISSNVNNESPIMIISYMGKKVMLTGDANEKSEKFLIENLASENLDVDILKVGHHGSDTSSCQDFLAEVKPEVAIISVGENNKYNHPTDETLSRLYACGVSESNLYRTDNNGTVVALISGSGEISVNSNYVSTISFYIHWYYCVAIIFILTIFILFVPKFYKQKALKHLKK